MVDMVATTPGLNSDMPAGEELEEEEQEAEDDDDMPVMVDDADDENQVDDRA